MKSFLKKAERAVRRFFISCLGRFFPVSPVSAEEVLSALKKGEAQKILFIGVSLKIGQFLCVTPMFRAFRGAYPQASLEFIGNPVNAPAARANPQLGQVWVRPPFWNLAALIGFLRNLRRKKFDLAVLLTTEKPSASGLLLARASGSLVVAGYASPEDPLVPLYHWAIPYVHHPGEVDKFMSLGRSFGAVSADLSLEFSVRREDAEKARSFFEAHALSGRPRIGLFVGGKIDRPERLWPIERFATLAKSLENHRFSWVAVSPPGGRGRDGFQPGEEKRLKEFLAEFPSPRPVFQAEDLGFVAAFLKELDLLISPDGGVMHLSVAVGTPTLALFFETDPAVWFHPGPRQFYLKSRDGRPSSLSVDEVVKKTLEALSVVSSRG